MNDFTDAFAEGREVYDCGVDESKNPYDPETQADDLASWNDGYNIAADEAEED